MDFRIHSTQDGRETLVFAEGKILLGESTQLLKDFLRGLIERGHVRLRLSLKEVQRIDSSGLGELAWCAAAVARVGGYLCFEEAPPQVAKVLELTGLMRISESADANVPTGVLRANPADIGLSRSAVQ